MKNTNTLNVVDLFQHNRKVAEVDTIYKVLTVKGLDITVACHKANGYEGFQDGEDLTRLGKFDARDFILVAGSSKTHAKEEVYTLLLFFLDGATEKGLEEVYGIHPRKRRREIISIIKAVKEGRIV